MFYSRGMNRFSVLWAETLSGPDAVLPRLGYGILDKERGTGDPQRSSFFERLFPPRREPWCADVQYTARTFSSSFNLKTYRTPYIFQFVYLSNH
jgi:hypothetical protein